VGGPTLAASFVRRGLVDEYRLVVHPVTLGSRTRLFRELESPIPLRLAETRRFESGVVYLGYATDRASPHDLVRFGFGAGLWFAMPHTSEP
jgi:riboflavin biosynthesis pyrimidine reductase